MAWYGILSIVFLSGVWSALPVKHDDCTYEFDMDKKVIKVACLKNVTVTVRGEGNTMLVTGNEKDLKPLWFEHHRKSNKSSRAGNFNTKATSKLKNANKLLRRTKKRLVERMSNIVNITTELELGNIKLKKDAEILQRYSPGSALAHQSIIAALQNQYKYLQMAMLSQTNEMKQLISSMTSLVSATQKSIRSAIAMGDEFQEELIMLNTALVRSNISKVGKRKDYCPRMLSKIDAGLEVVKVGIAEGSIMKDPIPAGQYWVTYGYSDINEVASYKTLTDFELDIASRKRKLPFFCEGTGHTVYKNFFYCQKMMTSKIVRYNLLESRWLGELELPGAGAHNTYPYESDRFSDVDFAVDEYGLWVIYAASTSNGNIIISKLEEDNFTISETWVTNIPKRGVGNSFMICGILYCTDSFVDRPTFIKYIYNTNTGGNKIFKKDNISFQNSIRNDYAANYMLDYNPLDRKLYSWNHGRVEIYSTKS